METKLLPCPFCGKTPELYFDGDDTYVVECKHHDWCKRDEDGTRFAADIAIYAEAESMVNEKLEWYVPPNALELAKRKAIAAWNTRHERICELIKHAARDEESGIELVLYECGQCGWIVDPSRNERYCPNCGAKVVEE